MTPPQCEIAQQRTVRLIASAHYKPPVLRALVDTADELAAIERIEARTSKRLTSAPAIVTGNLDRWGQTYIAAAFTYTRPGGNRFNTAARGAWYAAFDDRTALHEVAFHHTRELEFSNHLHDEVQYRALHASFIGRFHDLRNSAEAAECLDPDPRIGYPAGQAVATHIIGHHSRGLVYPSVRLPGGTCLVAFQPNVVQDVAPGACWKITWNGSRQWIASAV